MALACIFTVGCQTDNNGGDSSIDIENEDMVLTVSLEQTKTSLDNKADDAYPCFWSEGDKIVVNGALSDEVEIDAENRAIAKFRISESTPSYPYHITYPYCTSTSTDKAIVEFLAEQRYAEGTFATNSAPMCGYVERVGDKVSLNHLAAVLHFPIKAKVDGVVLEKVVITSENDIAGEFKVDCQNVTISATESCNNVTTYTLPENFTLSTTTTRDLFIVLPAVEVGACTIEFFASGDKMTAKWTPDKPLSKGVVREFKPITYSSGVVGELQGLPAYEDEFDFFYKKYASNNELKIMSFNVRTNTSNDIEEKSWENRKGACVKLIKDQQPSIIGFQEAKYTSQWLYLKEQLADEYEGFGVNRDTGAESGNGETMGILYKKGIIEKINGGTFWLSETPNVASKGWGAGHCRTATWGIFKHIPTGVTFYYINTHLDHQVAEAQVEGMKLIAQHFEKYKETYPLFLTGDMNIRSENVALDVIEGYMYNARDNAPKSLTDYNTTYNGYVTNKDSIIDHIYCSNNLQVVEYHTINEDYGVTFVSDHYPVYAIVKLK